MIYETILPVRGHSFSEGFFEDRESVFEELFHNYGLPSNPVVSKVICTINDSYRIKVCFAALKTNGRINNYAELCKIEIQLSFSQN